VFLKALVLKGFKSFADATTLELEPGVTVVVGPNGSGKSNVVDAIAWVLGAQGPRTVRSTKMDDVIFAGSSERPSLGRAEVSLVIDNSSGRIPVPMSEITITRTLFRSGESEYAINRAPCRLLDVQELLSDTGVGRQQHVIVGQGQLDAVLNARPEDRRLMVEEAAGVLKFRRRRERAERRLEATEGNLVRLQDLLREVRRQLRPLERQAEVARRHDEVAAELRAVRLYLAGRELAELAGRQRDCSDGRDSLGRQEQLLRSRLSALDEEIAAREAELDAARSTDLGNLLGRVEGLRERARGLEGLIGERRRGTERTREARLDADLASALEEERGELSAQLAQVEEELAQLAAGDSPAEERGAAAEPDESRALASAREQLIAVRRGMERDEAELQALEGRLATLRRKADLLDGETARHRAEHERRLGETGRLAASALEAAERAAAAEVAASEAEEAFRRAERDSHTWSARAEALSQALGEASAGSGADSLAGATGVIGPLADLVRVDPGWEAAFDASTEDVSRALVTAGHEDARSALGLLEKGGAAGTVLAPGGVIDPAAPEAPAGSEPVRPHVQGTVPEVELLLDELLAGVVVAAGGWEEALDLHLERRDLTVVTRAGDRFSPRGWRFGGAREEGPSRAALEEASRSAERCAAAASEASRRLTAAREELASLRAAASERERQAGANEAQLEAVAEVLRAEERQRGEVEEELAEASRRRAELEARRSREVASASELERSVAALGSRAEASARRAAELAAERTAREVRAAGLRERAGLLSGRMAELDRRLAANDPDERERRFATAAREAVALERLLGVVSNCRAAAGALLRTLETGQARQGALARSLTERLSSLRGERADAERELAAVRERAQRAELEDAELRLRAESLSDSVRRELDCEPDEAVAAPPPELPPGTSPRTRLSELERELRLIGPVNALAKEELASLSERHELLEAQLEDVRSARRELAKVIRAVDAEIVEVFAAAYADVAESFDAIFSTLFPGGHGQLRLTDPADLLATGIDVEAKPVGRGVKKLSLLSGGERSLVALAFLFAIFRSRPSPFYVLDEVEAALDDVNLAKFLILLDEFREEAQLIVVSHQKATMEAADCLYGVSMQRGGSSRVVSERMRESEPA
jgi:chromosome segregation protein